VFDIAFSELLLIAVVALIVIGPERLPKVARTLGLLAGRLQRYVSAVKADVERELRVHELQNLNTEVRETVSGVQSNLEREARQIESAVATPLAEAAKTVEEAGKSEAPPSAP
jgi:sec-independent protein translocase protein TatB